MREPLENVSDAYRRYVLGMMTLVYSLGTLDQSIMVLLVEPIKHDLRLTDSQLGFLTGIAYALLYGLLGVPVARWSDRGNRATIAAVAIGLWGITVMACLWVSNFAQLAVARTAASIGGSGCMPPTYSLAGDYFPKPAERARAMAIYWLAGPLPLVVSFVVGAWLNERYGWRLTLFLVGIPGVLLSFLVKKTVREPRALRHSPHSPRYVQVDVKILHVAAHLWSQRSARNLSVALLLFYTVAFGLGPWYAAFMMRSHHVSISEVGLWLGVIFGSGGSAGVLLGGYIAGRWFAHDERTQMRVCAASIALMVPCLAAFLLSPVKQLALIALVPFTFVLSFFSGPAYALMQRLVPEQMRATALALVMLLANLIGLGLGPQIVGVASDRLQPLLGDDSLRYAMLLLSFVALWSAWHFWRVGASVSGDLRSVSGNSSTVRDDMKIANASFDSGI